MSQTTIAIIFVTALSILLYLLRKKIQIQGTFPILYIVLIRTKLGLEKMEQVAQKFPKTFDIIYTFGIGIGFLGMAFILAQLIMITVKLASGGGAGIVPVLPIETKGVFYVPFFYWIISIFVIATIHEFSHGIAARTYKIPVKSSGIAFLGLIAPIIPAAFVEPDEKTMSKHKTKQQLGVFAAGAMANITTAFVFLALMIGANSAAEGIILNEGVEITKVLEQGPAMQAGIKERTTITSIDGQPIKNTNELMKKLETSKTGQEWKVQTNENTYTMALGTKTDKTLFKTKTTPYMGLNIRDKITINATTIIDKTLIWTIGLLKWLFILSLGIGLFNLLPAGPLDGGRMLKLVLEKTNKQKYWNIVSKTTFALVLVNLAAGFFI